METRLADVCSRTPVRSRLNRYLCKWLSIILSGRSGEQLQRNCMGTEIIYISLRANYWQSCLWGFNRSAAVRYSFDLKPAFEAFLPIWVIYSMSLQSCHGSAEKLYHNFVMYHINENINKTQCQPIGRSPCFLFGKCILKHTCDELARVYHLQLTRWIKQQTVEKPNHPEVTMEENNEGARERQMKRKGMYTPLIDVDTTSEPDHVLFGGGKK